MLMTYFDKVGDWNPQLFRELKGRLKVRNLSIAAVMAVGIQCLVLLVFSSHLPTDLEALKEPPFQYSRYCTATPPPNSYAPHQQLYCIQDLLGHWVVNWQLWWLDIFNTLSVLGLFILLVAGTYLLIADLSKEENRGTFNFIRLSPRSANNILVGKILGVPCVIYFLCLILLPLHLLAGFQAQISPSLIVAYYGGILVSCAFFFSLSLLFGLVSSELGGFQSFLGSGAVLSFLLIMTSVTFSSNHFISHTPFDWIILFYPGILLSYLAESSYFPTDTVGLDYENFYHLAWYGQHFWRSSTIGMGLIVGNYGLWTYWINQALNRRFRNPNATWLSKLNSYWLSGSFIIIVSGFVFQSGRYGNLGRHIFENFAILQVFTIFFACLLMVALSPQRQTLHDWARYRHQTAYNRRSRLVDLILGEKSPSPLAIALNLAIIFAYLLPTILIAPLNKPFALLLCLFFSINMLIICAVIGQRILLCKLPKPSLIAAFAIAVIIVVLPIFLGIFDILPHRVFTPWLFTVFSVPALFDSGQPFTLFSILFTLISQWGLIALTSVEMGKRLNKVGESDSKALLNT